MVKRALGVVALLVLHAVLALEGVRDRSPTADEPLHLISGVSYWKLNDYRLQPENGNLPMRWAAWPVVAQGVTLPVEGEAEAWRYTDAPRLQRLFMYGGSNDHVAMLTTARRAALVWNLALGLLLFAWTQAVWGRAAGFVALAMFALSPTMLAHGPLVTSDASAAFFLLAACGAFWRALHRPSVASVLLSGVVTGLCAVAKFSVVMLPFAFALMVAFLLWRRQLAWRPFAALLAAQLILPALVIWASFGFRYEPVGADAPAFAQYYRLWSFTLPPDGLLRTLVEGARAWRLLPDAYLYGFTHVYASALERSAFLNAEHSTTGWWWFFPYAFLVKSTLAELLLVGVGAWVLLRRWGGAARTSVASFAESLAPAVPLLALLLVYGAFSVTSNLNIGHRHLLPMYAPLFMLAAGAVTTTAVRWPRALALLCVGVAVVEALAVRPHYLTYFNASVGGPANGWRHLVDSSLDWGQDLPRLAQWLRAERREGEPVYVSMFGAGVPSAYGIDGMELAPDWPDLARPWVEWGGGVYAISATRLQGVYNPFHGTWTPEMERIHQELGPALRREIAAGLVEPRIAPDDGVGPNLRTLELLQFARLTNYLRNRTPDARIANTVFVYRLTDDEVQAAARGSTREYLALLDRAR